MSDKRFESLSDKDRARRHVLSQQMYRLRRRYREAKASMVYSLAANIKLQLEALAEGYDALGGLPHHPGNVL